MGTVDKGGGGLMSDEREGGEAGNRPVPMVFCWPTGDRRRGPDDDNGPGSAAQTKRSASEPEAPCPKCLTNEVVEVVED